MTLRNTQYIGTEGTEETFFRMTWMGRRGGGGWHKASVSDCLPLAAPIGLSPLLILTLCGPERVLVVSTEALDDLSCLTTPYSGVRCPGDGLFPMPLTRSGGGGGGSSLQFVSLKACAKSTYLTASMLWL